MTGCDPGGPSPYTPALEALGIPIAGPARRGHVTDAPPPDRLAVTKALTAVAPDHPELRAARAAASRRAVAAGRRRRGAGRNLVAVAGTHGKSTTAGWLVHALVAAGDDPSAFVGALLPAELTGGPPATARVGTGTAFVVEADEYAGNFDAYRPDVAVLTDVEWDHPDVFADRAAVIDAFDAWLRRMADGSTLVANIGDPGAEAVVDRLRDRSLAVVAYALVDASPGRGGYLRGIGERYATAAGTAGALLGRIVAADADGTSLEVDGLDPLAGAVPSASPRPVATTPPTRWRSRAPRSAWAWRRTGSPPASPRSRASAGAWNARARPRRRGVRRLRPSPDGHRRDARGGPPARARDVASGRSTSR